MPGCPFTVCASPTAIFQGSRDRGATWGVPHPIAPSGTEQVDTQIVVDPVDGRTLYASWLQNRKSDTVVARSTDLGNSWSVVIADHTNAGTDKPILAVRGQHVYVAYDHCQTVLVSSSHDGGATFTTAKVNANANLGWSLAGGGTVTPDGSVYFAFLGAQMTLASDEAGTFYALWNAGAVDKGPERIFFSRSEDGGATWSPRVDVSRAPAAAAHAFPAVVAGAAGDVRISFGDYFEMAIDDRGDSHLIWGEGLNWQTPESIWYARGR